MLSGLHFLTHIAMSWALAHLAGLSRRDRGLVVLATIVPDFDGIGILWSDAVYEVAHRVIGHGIVAALAIVALAAAFAERRLVTAVLAAVSFHVHLFVDVVGTGGAPIQYFWPFSDRVLWWSGHWSLGSWQNAVVTAGTAAAVLWIAWRHGRTPFEHVSLRVDRAVVGRLRRFAS
jgi:hypothetical protein